MISKQGDCNLIIIMYKVLHQVSKEDFKKRELLPTGHSRIMRHSRDCEIRQKIMKGVQRPQGAQRREKSRVRGQGSGRAIL